MFKDRQKLVFYVVLLLKYVCLRMVQGAISHYI